MSNENAFSKKWILVGVGLLALGYYFGAQSGMVDGKNALYWQTMYEFEKSSAETTSLETFEPELSAEEIRQNNIDGCIATAYLEYDRQWKFKCNHLELEPIEGEDGCALPAFAADVIHESLENDKWFCLQRYQ